MKLLKIGAVSLLCSSRSGCRRGAGLRGPFGALVTAIEMGES